LTGGGDGGAFIVGLDTETGKEAWRFYSIAREGAAGNSWNGLPIDKRHGGSVWTSGSYDAEHNLAFFGPAPSYDTGPLLNKSDKPGVTNDALYTDTTIALNPDTGKLVWYYQHVKNDQWDLDWAFERQIVHLSVDGQDRKLVLTAGKEAVWDALDAATGKYVFSYDMGIQNVIKAIDPVTGVKTINPDVMPSHDHPVTICPHGGGGRDWIPTSFNPTTKIIYVPAEETCMVFTPVAKGEHGFLSSGVGVTLSPPAKSDGNVGRLEAINMQTKKSVWVARQRAAQSSGVLDTAGGVVFASAIDRWFTAYDDSNGKVLWRARLADIANAPPISYSVDGKQYIALITGYGSSSASTFTVLTPEIPLPVVQGSQVWVFALPGDGTQKYQSKSESQPDASTSAETGKPKHKWYEFKHELRVLKP
jgi:alcohol dehydrogenase (cytochrome c)